VGLAVRLGLQVRAALLGLMLLDLAALVVQLEVQAQADRADQQELQALQDRLVLLGLLVLVDPQDPLELMRQGPLGLAVQQGQVDRLAL